MCYKTTKRQQDRQLLIWRRGTLNFYKNAYENLRGIHPKYYDWHYLSHSDLHQQNLAEVIKNFIHHKSNKLHKTWYNVLFYYPHFVRSIWKVYYPSKYIMWKWYLLSFLFKALGIRPVVKFIACDYAFMWSLSHK